MSYQTTTTRLDTIESGHCALIQDLLPLYLEDEVSPDARSLIAEHLAACPACTGFLAGARSIREQLRREQAQRANAAAPNAPAQHAVSFWQQVTIFVLTLAVCALSAIGVAGMVFGVQRGPGAFSAIGLLICLGCYATLLAMAATRSSMSVARALSLGASNAVLCAGALLLFTTHGAPLFTLLSFPLGAIGFFGVWLTVSNGLSRPRAAQSA